MSFQVKVGVSELIGKEGISDWCADMSNAGIEVEVIEFPNHPIAALEWLLPTGIVLYLFKPYFETILKEAAKDHYQILKKVISEKIHPRYIGKSDQKIASVTASGEKKTNNYFSRTFSISTSLHKDEVKLEVKLLIPENASRNEVVLAFKKFANFITDDEGMLVSSLIESDNDRLCSKALWLNPESQTIELIDVVKSSKNKKVVSMPLKNKT